jgi:hypothetical protein
MPISIYHFPINWNKYSNFHNVGPRFSRAHDIHIHFFIISSLISFALLTPLIFYFRSYLNIPKIPSCITTFSVFCFTGVPSCPYFLIFCTHLILKPPASDMEILRDSGNAYKLSKHLPFNVFTATVFVSPSLSNPFASAINTLPNSP